MIKHPDATTLLRLEREARHRGTGLTADDLEGHWMLQGVWSKGNLRPASFSLWGLRGLRARLVVHQRNPKELQISNAVSLGPLRLQFDGAGRLKGSRPLLQFSFNRVALFVWNQCWINRSLPQPAPSRMPFFALIHRDPAGWLAARGRGGGLAFWELNPEGEDETAPVQTEHNP